MVNPVASACASLGLALRKHTPDFHSWTARVPTVVDLDEAERTILERDGEAALDAYLRGKKCFAFPALDIAAPRPLQRETVLVCRGDVRVSVVCPPDDAVLGELAARLLRLFTEATGTAPPVVSDAGIRIDRRRSRSLIILGGSHQNAAARFLSARNLSYADRRTPGRNGLLVHTLHGLYRPSSNLILVAADEGTVDEAVALFGEALTQPAPGVWALRRLHVVRPGRELAAEVEPAAELLKAVAPMLDVGPGDDLSWETLGDAIRAVYDSGGPEVNLVNNKGLYSAVRTFHAYQLTANPIFLQLYKALLWGLVDYHLVTPGGASYISDVDFPAGDLIVSWSLAEATPVFSTEERLVITATLLALARQVCGYKAWMWPTGPKEFRFNHETFPALSLWRAAWHFGSCYGISDAREWRGTAREVFAGPIGKVFKHTENANGYQWLTPMHKLIFDVSSGLMETVKNENICRTAHSAAAVIDNFGWGVDYGDSGCFVGTGSARLLPLLTAGAGVGADGTLAWVAEHVRNTVRDKALMGIAPGGQMLLGQNVQAIGAPPESGRWEVVELDDHIRRRHQPSLPRRYVADKIGFREAWAPEAQFLLFEPYSVDGHIHYDMNAILRYNHLSRVWLVDNGYGRPSGMTNVAKSFSTRQRGPEDHNLVIFRDRSGAPVIPPPFGAILALDSADGLFLLQSALCNINGAEWLRSIVLVRGRLLIVIDQVKAGGAESAIECQLNALGRDALEDSTWLLEQDGVNLSVQVRGGCDLERSVYSNQSWDEVLTTGAYPHAPPGVRKLRQVVARPRQGQRATFVALVAAGASTTPSYVLERGNAPSVVTVCGPFEGVSELASDNLTARLTGDRLDVALREDWRLPPDLTPEMFGDWGARPTTSEILRESRRREARG